MRKVTNSNRRTLKMLVKDYISIIQRPIPNFAGILVVIIINLERQIYSL